MCYTLVAVTFWEQVLITSPVKHGDCVNERPMQVESGFFVGRAKLKSEA